VVDDQHFPSERSGDDALELDAEADWRARAACLSLILLLQNWGHVYVYLLFWDFRIRLVWALLGAFLLGALLGWLVPICGKKRKASWPGGENASRVDVLRSAGQIALQQTSLQHIRTHFSTSGVIASSCLVGSTTVTRRIAISTCSKVRRPVE
jgi:hypothetical protein